MKNHPMKTACALITGLLAASTSVLAQVAPPTPTEVAPSYGYADEVSFVLPKAAPAPNFYLEGGPTYMYAKPSGNSDEVNFFGGTVAFGWRIDKNNKIQVEVGALAANDEYYGYEQGIRVKIKEDDFAMPWLFSYSYCLPLDPQGRCELRLTPTVGLFTMSIKFKGSGSSGNYYASVSDDDSDSSLAYGGGIGFTYHINQRFYIDAGYRYLRAGSTEYNLFGEKLKLDSMDTHTLTASFGWKF